MSGHDSIGKETSYPPYSRVIIQPKPVSVSDKIAVRLSSFFIVGSLIWGPFLSYSLVKKLWQKYGIDKRSKRKLILLGTLFSAFIVVGPYRNRKIGRLINIRGWNLWKSWLKFVAFEVVQDLGDGEHDDLSSPSLDLLCKQAILSIVPHGIFPFSLGLAALPEDAIPAFGMFRPVVASATSFFPILRTIISWLGFVDASRSSVNAALTAGHSIGLAPGGIAEMFEGYPKLGRSPNDEVALLANRKGFIRMALNHKVPVVPVYSFGSTKMLKRLELPLLESLSNFMRVSVCLFFGQFGMPVPFQQKLLYVMGRPIFPPDFKTDFSKLENTEQTHAIDAMHRTFCVELDRIFNKYKHSYGWGHKSLKIV